MSLKRDFEPSELVVLRTPLLPMEEIEAWTSDLLSPACAGDDAALEEALAHDRALLRRRLRDSLERPELREAVFLASPDLTESLAQWQRDPDGKKGRRTEHGLVRYFLRMASRPTPFGLFSGCTAGRTGRDGERTRFTLAPRTTYQRHSRLDMDYLFALCEHLGSDPELRSEVLFRPNSSLFEVAGRFRYAESRVNGRLRTYHLVAVDAFDALRDTIARARDGARLQDLALALVADDPDQETTLEEAESFLHELVDNQILVSDLALPVTGEESTPSLLSQLGRLPSAAGTRERLARAERTLAGIDAGGLGSEPGAYRDIARDLEPLGVTVEMSRLFQVDMVKPAQEVVLGQDMLDEILRGIDILHRVSPPWREGPLEDFRNAFRERYGDGREVPLMEVLDEESGLGFERSNQASAGASPLLNGLMFYGRNERMTVPWSLREVTLLRLLSETLAAGRTAVELAEETVSRLAAEARRPLPDAFHAMITLAAGSPETLDRGEYRLLLEHASGPSGARLLGRFCHADDAVMAGVQTHLAAEEAHAPGAVFAEIVHLPAGRIGNILARPVLRSHEITFLGRSGAPRERQIQVEDLTVTVAAERIRLRSKTLGREVVPCLTTAHNAARESLGVYRFLAALQGQNQAGALQWSWGPLEMAPFLPRVTSGRLVLSRARWRISKADMKPLASVTGAARYRLARPWREERRMPRYIALVDADNELLLDFLNPLNLDSVVDLVKNREESIFTEVFPAPDELCARGPEGRFFHEVLVPFVRRPAERPQPVVPSSASALHAPRSFAPGSEWLYAKIYTGTGTADQVLRDEIGPLAREAVAAGHARSWFFLRYGDPDWHLRVRFHGQPARLRETVLPRLEEVFRRLLAAGAAWKCQLDTYDREVERYGGPGGIGLSEEVFFHDSEAVLDMLDSFTSDAGADLRWRLTLAGMDRMLEDFGFDLEARQRLAERGRAGFAGRYRHEPLRGPLADRLRQERPSLERLLSARREGPEEVLPGLAALARRSEALGRVARELYGLEGQSRLHGSVAEIVPSYLHMFVNRLSRSAGPEHEMVTYDFLAQIYSSLLARNRKAGGRGMAVADLVAARG
jgi:thiopeptide-type bacteriocin biosynthesis protein